MAMTRQPGPVSFLGANGEGPVGADTAVTGLGRCAEADAEEAALEQLADVHSLKTGFYARWRGTSRDLERALDGVRALSDALCVTSPEPAAQCNSMLYVVGQLFGAEWALLRLSDGALPA